MATKKDQPVDKSTSVLNNNLSPDVFPKMAENLPGIVFRLHLQENHRIQFLNKSAEFVTGYTEEELPGGEHCPIVSLIIEEDRSRVIEEIKQALSECRPFTLQYRLRHKNGSIRYMLEQGNPVKGKDGRIKYIYGLINDITFFKQLEKDLQENEIRFRQMAEHIHEVFWLCNKDLTEILYISPAYEEIWGRSCQSLYQKPSSFMDPIHPEDQEEMIPFIINNFSKGYDKEFRIIRPDGSVRWVRDRAFPVRDEKGEIYRIAGIATDITDQKETEQLLREQSQIIDQIHDSVIMTDLDGYVTYWNKGAERMFGYTSKEALGQHISIVYTKEQLSLLQNEIIAPLKKKGEHVIEVPLKNKSGRIFFVHLSLSLIKDATGKPKRMIGYCMDIDERKKAEQELQLQANKLTSILESFSDGFFSVDRNWRYTYVNSQAEKMLGKKRAELLNHTIWEVFPEAIGTTFDKEYHKALSRQKTTCFVEYYEPMSKWFEVHAFPFTEGLSVYFQDVTERIYNERELKARANRQRIITDLGLSALSGTELSVILNEAIEKLSTTLEVKYAKILELLPDGKSLLLRTGKGWKTGNVGKTRVETSIKSQAGYTLQSNKPVVVEDFQQEKRFKIPSLLKDHQVQSGISTIIYGTKKPFGVLGIHSDKPRKYTESEVDFVQSIANTIALAIHNDDANMALQHSEQRFRSIFENAAAGMVTTDIKGRFLQVNPKFCRFLGYPEKELLQLTAQEVTYPEDREVTNAQFQVAAVANHKVFDLVKRYVRKNGKVVWGHTTTAWVYDSKSKPFYCIKLIQDITRLKVVEQALRESEEKFRTIVETAPNLILISNKKGKNIYVSPNCKEITGYSQKELLSEIRWWVHKDDNKKARKFFNLALEKGTGYKNFEYKAVKKNGKIWYASSSWNSMKDENGEVKGMVVETMDITERKHAEKQLKKSREQLRQLSIHLQTVREEEQERMARKIHDEIGQMLVGLQMNLSWLSEQIAPDSTVLMEKINYLQQRTEESIDVVEKIASELRPRMLDVLGLKEAILWQLQELKETRGIRSVYKSVPQSLTLSTDYSNALYRLFQEAMVNVIRHSNATEVRVYLKQNKNFISFKIEDNGTGITQEQIDEPHSFGIMGMQERVQHLNGEISIRGIPDKGTQIQIKLPLQNPEKSDD
jgi:PAS domain S-box-containing protein